VDAPASMPRLPERGGAVMHVHGVRRVGQPAWPWLVASVCLLIVAAPPAAADEGQPGAPGPGAQPRGAPDFLFSEPNGSIGLRGSWVFARAGSDLFDFVQDQLTIDKGDFRGPGFALDVGIIITPRIEAVFGVEMSRASIGSEYRQFVDNNRLPIEQTTKLSEANLSGSVRFALTPRGRRVSRFAWVPNRFTPYVGAGAGYLWYEFEQVGDFVDFVDLSVFADHFQSSGWTPSAHVFGGLDITVYRRLLFSVEGRYLWAAGELGTDFIDFDPIDMAGARITAGINLLF
jgi:opacity protein-like surface antigen